MPGAHLGVAVVARRVQGAAGQLHAWPLHWPSGAVEVAEEDLDGWICREPATAVTLFAVVLRIAIEEEIGNFVFLNLSSILTLNFYRSRNSMNE